ncbi:MAG: hypothetical protein ACI9WU_001513 [Myxococcota bacterium]
MKLRVSIVVACCSLFLGACTSQTSGGGSSSGSSGGDSTTGADTTGGSGADGGTTETGGDTGDTTGGDTAGGETTGGETTGDATGDGTGTTDGVVEPTGLALLGNGKNSVNFVVLEEIAGPDAGLSVPRDAEINPDRPTELWTVNTQSESVVVIHDYDTAGRTTETFWSLGSHHFMGRPAALAFGAPNVMATIHDTDELTQGPNGTPADFMGPTTHATHNLALFDAGHGSHLDMLHNSPNGVGIAWEADNIYWVFDGYHSSVTRYDFRSDHGMGGADHSDAVVSRCVEGEVTRAPGSVSHMAYDQSTDLLYIADTGNNRIAVLDATTGSKGSNVGPNYDGGDQHKFDGVNMWTLVDGLDHDISAPAGLELHDDMIWLTDNATSRVYAFDLDGKLVDWMDTYLEAGSLNGLALDGKGNLILTDSLRNRVYMISALEQ